MLPKQEVTIYLSADRHAKLKAMAKSKGVAMSAFAAWMVERGIDARYAELVSVFRALRSSGIAPDSTGSAGEAQTDFADTGFEGDAP